MKKDLQEQIFCMLGRHFSYDENVISSYAVTAAVRFGWPKAKTEEQFKELISEGNERFWSVVIADPVARAFPYGECGLFKLDGDAQRKELCLLDKQNLNKFLEKKLNPEMKRYLTAWKNDVEYPGLFAPSTKLVEAEHRMLSYLGDTPYEEGREKVSGIANATLRVIMQGWLLHPELLAQEKEVADIIDCLELSNCDF